MNFQRHQPAIAGFPKLTPKQAGAIRFHIALRDNFTISTWLAFGAVLQGIVAFFFNPLYAVAPVLLLLSYRGAKTLLVTLGIMRNTQMDDVLMGKHSVQVPDRDGNAPTKPSQENISIIMLGARSNHPLGIFGPGHQEVATYFHRMLVDLGKNKEESGFLGSSAWVSATERTTANQLMTVCYFRTTEDVHRFAHGALHREGWNWWNSVVHKYPHLSIMHEMYNSPPGTWENIFVNFPLSGIGNIQTTIKIGGQDMKPIMDIGRGAVSTSKGRMGKNGRTADEAVYEKQYV
ncbi:putative monooxygenase [Cladobotryum mycophilum]|uniref:Monooxygenase n=1 Tax=Cladobotryum mycophilum TaxID=491253 RepID=A0ABR0SIZ3_9HYPO